ETRWTTHTVYEADKKVAKDHMVLTLRKARQTVEKVQAERKEGFLLLKKWKVLDAPPEPFSPGADAGADPFAALDACAQASAQGLARLKAMRLPRYIRGIWPFLFLALVWGVATSPAYLVAEWYYWVAATTLTLIPVGLWIRVKLICVAEERAITAFEMVHQSGAGVRARFRVGVRQSREQYRAQKKQLRKRMKKQMAELTAVSRGKLTMLRRKRSEDRRDAEEKYEPMLFRLRRAHEAKTQADSEEHQAQLIVVQNRRDEMQRQAADRQRKLRDENNRRHAEDWTNLALNWKRTCDLVTTVFRQVDQESRRWFGSLDPAAHPLDRGMPWGLRFGTLDVRPQFVPHGIPAGGQILKPDFPLAGPALLQFPEKAALLLETKEQGRREGLRALEAVLLRAWLALPPGKLRCTIIDPVGRGENFAAFMHLIDHEPA